MDITDYMTAPSDVITPPTSNQIDFDFISKLEGGAATKGYVPDAKGSKSGVTISVGFDLGARNESDLKSLRLSKGLTDKLKPYLGLKGTVAQK